MGERGSACALSRLCSHRYPSVPCDRSWLLVVHTHPQPPTGWFLPYLCRTGDKGGPSGAESSPSPVLRCWLQTIAPLFHHIPVFCWAPAVCRCSGSQGSCPSHFLPRQDVFSPEPCRVGSAGAGMGPAGGQEGISWCVADCKTPGTVGTITATPQPAPSGFPDP